VGPDKVGRPGEASRKLAGLSQTCPGEIWSDREFAPVRRLHDATEHSLVWTRDPYGIYYLAQLNGAWEYRDAGRNRDVDLNNVRSAEIVAVAGAEAGVPGAPFVVIPIGPRAAEAREGFRTFAAPPRAKVMVVAGKRGWTLAVRPILHPAQAEARPRLDPYPRPT
jgi:hypothetical protein